MEIKQRMAQKAATTNKATSGPKGSCNKPTNVVWLQKPHRYTRQVTRPQKAATTEIKMSHGPKGHVHKQKTSRGHKSCNDK